MKESVRRRFQILKWIPRILMLGVIAFSVYVYLSYGKSAGQKGSERNRPTPPKKVVGQQSNISYSHYDQGVLIYHVNAERTKQFRSTAQELENPEFIFYDKDQKETIRVKGKLCNISKDLNSIVVSGDTHVESYNGMSVNAEVIKYDSRSKEFSTEDDARFTWKTLKGRSKGFVYKIDPQQLTLPKNPEIHYVNRGSENKKPIVMNGDRGLIDRLNGFSYFEGNVIVTQGKDKIKADRIETNFKPETHDLEKITAYNRVHVKFARPEKAGSESVRPPQADAAHQAPSMANVFTAEEGSAKDLHAELVELYFYEDGTTIRSFHSEKDCTFVLHSYDKKDKPTEDRIIKGDTFDAQFNLNNQMEQFHANENVSVRLQPMGEVKKEHEEPRQIIFCKDLVAYFVPETGDVKEIHFNDGFKHVQQKQTVTSDKAVYSGSLKKTDLIGNPEINDATFNITANSMELFEETSGIHAKGQVKSTFIRGEGKNPTTFPFSSPSKEPVYISAENMEWNGQKAEATYTDKAKLWQEKNVITTDKLIINDKENTLSAYNKVHTIFYNQKDEKKEDSKSKVQTQPAQTQSAQTQTAPQTQSQPKNENLLVEADTSEEGPISVDAGIMNYVEKDRIIHFEKDVKIVTPSTRIESEKADFFLKQESSDFDRLYAQGKVQIQHGAKKGTGMQATFYNEERKLILEGGPKLTEAGKADILGRLLTLFLSDGRILIDGQEDGRATTTLQMTAGYITPTTSSKSSKSSRSSRSSKKNAPDAGPKNRKPN